MKRLNRFAQRCWRVSYPILLYLLLFDLLAVTGIAAGVTRIGISAGLCIILLGPAYLCKERERLRINYIKTGAFGAAFCIIGNLVIAFLQISSIRYKQTEAVLFGVPVLQQILVIGFLAPLAEELVFRGLVFDRLREALRFWQAAILSALLFAVFHGNIVQGIYAFFGGLLMAWSYETYHSIKAPYCIHVISNLLSILLSMFTLGAISR